METFEVEFTNHSKDITEPLSDWFYGKSVQSIKRQFGKKWPKVDGWKIHTVKVCCPTCWALGNIGPCDKHALLLGEYKTR